MPKKKYNAPGKSHREGIGIIEITDMFPDEETAVKWFESIHWKDGRYCPHCKSRSTRKNEDGNAQPYRCNNCHKYFSVRMGTVMENSRIPVRKWVIAMYLMSTNLKGVSSMKLRRDLKVTQKTAWMMAQKIREGWKQGEGMLDGTVEVDEIYIGGKEKNKHNSKRSHTRGPSGKEAVVGIKDRKANKVVARHVPNLTKEEIQGFIGENVSRKAMVYTDEHKSYSGLPFEHESVNHSVGEYVREMAHTNGIESFWAVLKRGYIGTYHRISPKHLDRYVTEFAGRHNTRELDTIDQMASLAKGMIGKKLPYKKLVS